MIRGITLENIENFSNHTEALNNLDIKLILANYKKLIAKKKDNIWTFYKRGKSFGYVKDNLPVYEVDISTLGEQVVEALEVAFFGTEEDFKIELTCKVDDYAYIPIINRDKKTGRFSFDINNIAYCRVKSIYGNHKIFPMAELSVIGREDILKISDVPVIMLFSNIEKMIEAIKRTPNSGYKNLREYFDKCKDLIELKYKFYFGYSNKSSISFDMIKGYNSTKSTWTYGIYYDTDNKTAETITLPRAINSYTKAVYDKITELRVDSISKNDNGKEYFNLSINGEKIEIISENVKVCMDIIDINEDPLNF